MKAISSKGALGFFEVECQKCHGSTMLPGIAPDDDVMNTPFPQCNEWAKKGGEA